MKKKTKKKTISKAHLAKMIAGRNRQRRLAKLEAKKAATAAPLVEVPPSIMLQITNSTQLTDSEKVSIIGGLSKAGIIL